MDATKDQKLERLTREINALTEVAKTLSSPLELPELLEAVLNKISGVLEPAEVGAIMLWDHSSGLFRPGAAFGYDPEILNDIGLRAGESITGKVYDEGKARLLCTPEEISTAMADMRPANREVLARALGTKTLPRCTLAAPISVGEQKFGVLVLETFHNSAIFTENDLPFLQTLADLIALVIDRARLEAQADVVRATQQSEHLRSEVMGILSHQLRMPLSAIRGYATALLLDEVEWSEKKRREFLQLIDEESDNIQAMITEILDSALIDLDQLVIERQPMRLQLVAHDVVQEMLRRTETHRPVIDFPPDFPIVEADPRWIKQVFRNILDNAIKYSPDGGLIVIKGEVRLTDVVISIADQGLGISPEDLIPLFEKFFRVKSTSNLNIAGTGLGLPIARIIVEAHGGRIWAESKLGQGTTIYFSLPLGEFIANSDE